MMRKRFALVLVALLLMGTTGWAEEYSYLTFQKNDASNSETSVALASLSKITFSNGSLILTNAYGTNIGSYNLSELNKMFFAAQATAIENIQTDNTSITLQEGMLRINAVPGSKINLYQTSGAMVKAFSASASECVVNMSSLPKGIYLLRVNNQVKKILNR
jgi:hypothetical protein